MSSFASYKRSTADDKRTKPCPVCKKKAYTDGSGYAKCQTMHCILECAIMTVPYWNKLKRTGTKAEITKKIKSLLEDSRVTEKWSLDSFFRATHPR